MENVCVDFQSFNNVKVKEYETIEEIGKDFVVQHNYANESYPPSYVQAGYWRAIKNIGGTDRLAIPGELRLADIDSGVYRGLINVRTQDGEYIYGKPFEGTFYFKPSGIGEVTDESDNVEYYGIDGQKVKGQPLPGVYIERNGKNVRKVTIR